MLSYEDLRDAAAGEERDALMRAFAEDMAEASGRERCRAGFVRAERPADVARALGRNRRAQAGSAPPTGARR
ncbi:hypothetical protein [Methylobacterium sp.]|uniref:hypothetical protein n=1 Tax=Methylobacterium sp. TaxID=409 RepID=UPI000FBC37B2|nr:hypothetical protein [Methylobacterium sp.]RUP18536.1 MAG: hypothetical protein EKK44_23690 [Methylobacterium sp.]